MLSRHSLLLPTLLLLLVCSVRADGDGDADGKHPCAWRVDKFDALFDLNGLSRDQDYILDDVENKNSKYLSIPAACKAVKGVENAMAVKVDGDSKCAVLGVVGDRAKRRWLPINDSFPRAGVELTYSGPERCANAKLGYNDISFELICAKHWHAKTSSGGGDGLLLPLTSYSDPDGCGAHVIWPTVFACPKFSFTNSYFHWWQNWSWGWIFLFLSFACFAIYAVSGVLFNWGFRERNGVDIIPNYSFWCSLPKMVLDGCLFTVRTVKDVFSGRPVGYSKVSTQYGSSEPSATASKADDYADW